jgi:hypothetical protein
MKYLLTLLTLVALNTHAAEFILANITSNIDTDTTVFYLETNSDGLIDSLRYVTTTESGQISEDTRFTVEEVLNGGVVLEERAGYEAVRLFAKNFEPLSGGIIILNYLYNGVTSTRKELHLKLTREGNQFFLTTLKNEFVDCIYLQGNWIRIVGLVGIRNIHVKSCKP